MKLNDFLKEQGKTPSDLHRETGIQIASCYKYAQGKPVRNLERAKKIAEWTFNQVTIEELMK